MCAILCVHAYVAGLLMPRLSMSFFVCMMCK